MALLYGSLANSLIRFAAPANGITNLMDGSAYAGKSKLEVLLGKNFWTEIKGLRVLDFGCGLGDESIEMAQHGADVTGVDIVESYLTQARAKARDQGVKVQFTNQAEGSFNVILSFDAFEHYADPAQILN
jgi:2-polyprenyl-3-methyl-5-hydroxy-6-metoxy-1,4-benzoquinol methylase